MEINDIILNKTTRIKKVVLIPILSFLGFVIYSFLRGFGNNQFESTAPVSVKLEFPIWFVLVLALILFLIISIIIKIYTANDYEYNNQIHISENKTIVDTPYYRITFKNKASKYYQLSISRFWGIFFPAFYRVGKLKINYKGDQYSFLFPVRNMSDEQKIKEKFQ